MLPVIFTRGISLLFQFNRALGSVFFVDAAGNQEAPGFHFLLALGNASSHPDVI